MAVDFSRTAEPVDREAALAAIRGNDPAPGSVPEPEQSVSTTLTELRSQLDGLQQSVRQLSTAQNGTTDAVNAILNTPTPPDPSAAIEALTKRLDTVATQVAELAKRPAPEPPAALDLSATSLDRIKAAVAASATEATAVSSSGRTRPPVPTDDERRAAKELAAMLARAEALAAEVRSVGDRLSWDHDRSLKFGLLALPYAVVFVAAVALMAPMAEVLGVGPLARWAWSSFETADSVLGRGAIVLAAFAVIAGLVFGIYKGGAWLAAKYKAL